MSLFTRKPKSPTPSPVADTAAVHRTSTGPAVDLAKMEATAPGLVSLYKSAGVSLCKQGLEGSRAAVYLVLDYSGSMQGFYADGSVQAFAERVLAAAAHFDDDGIVPVVFFGWDAHRPESIALDSYQGRIAALMRGREWGSTNYVAAMEAVCAHYRASGATDPALVIFQTDGAPDHIRDTEAALRDMSSLPIFWQFVGFGRDDFRFLRNLDTLSGRLVDNAGFFAAGAAPRAMPDGELYDNLMGEFPQWLRDARTAGVL
ncbi:VWA domain-containing protein [Embleya sp. NPDC005971]|uniref:VWA domain-containing protein n=1 Tax=Embleya sp. NPDC005971 TaxID=3156724 RepID=UPI00341049CE